VLPDDADTVDVDQMNHAQARELVTGGIVGLPEPLGEQLLDLTGRWPLALGLANAALRRAVRDGADVEETAQRLLRRLRDLGPAALDVTVEIRRDRAVAATLESSLGVLGDLRERVVELAMFPEDTEIPAIMAVRLWGARAIGSRSILCDTPLDGLTCRFNNCSALVRHLVRTLGHVIDPGGRQGPQIQRGVDMITRLLQASGIGAAVMAASIFSVLPASGMTQAADQDHGTTRFVRIESGGVGAFAGWTFSLGGRIRICASSTCEPVANTKYGDDIYWVSSTRNSAGNLWYQVSYPRSGWIYCGNVALPC